MMISGRASLVAAIDIGGSTTKVSLVSDHGLVGKMRTLPTPQALTQRDFLDVLIRELKQLDLMGSHLAAIGVAVPGFIDEHRRSLKTCVNIPWLAGNPWINSLEEEFGIPAVLEVDGNAAGLGEHRFGAGRDSRRLLVLALGTGVGCAMLINGDPLRFTGGCCGDWGHIYVGGSERCSAGCKGCLESVVSVRALGGSAERTHELIREAIRGNNRSVEALRRAGHALGVAIASMAAVFEPDLVLLTGGISQAGDLIAKPAAQSFHENGSPLFCVPVRKGSFGAAATLAGAAVGLL